MRYIIFCLVLIVGSEVSAQTVQSLTGYSNVLIASMVIDNAGNRYETGSFSSTADFGGTKVTSDDPNDTSKRIFIAKYDANGTLIWVHAETGTSTGFNGGVVDQAIAIVQDKAHNLYVAGRFQSATFTLDGTVLKNTDNESLSEDLFLLKYSPDGKLIWLKGFGGPSDEEFNSLALSPSGTLYGVGAFSSPQFSIDGITLTGTTSFDDAAFIASFDTSGHANWAKSFPAPQVQGLLGTGGSNILNFLAIDSNGGIYTAGSFGSDTIRIGDTLLVYHGDKFTSHSWGVLMKFTAAGNVAWVTHSEEDTSSTGSETIANGQLVIDKHGNVDVPWLFTSPSVVFGSLTLKNPDTTRSSGISYLMQISPLGTPLGGSIGNANPNGIDTGGLFILGTAVSEDGDIYLLATGISKHGFSFGGSQLPAAGDTCFYIIRISGTDIYESAVAGTSKGGGGAAGIALCFGPNNTLYAAGYYLTVLDSVTLGTKSISVNGNGSFVADLGVQNQSVATTRRSDGISQVYPNPLLTSATIIIPENVNLEKLTISLFDVLGREVRRVSLPNSRSIRIERDGLSSGIYSYRILQSSLLVASGKFAVE